ncbi:ribonuclease FAU-1 family protein [Nocardia callitridis]|uniref:DUF402 domain-containing protein n=1 Tax=Nocardia callitridis TaxID=648753 RepID=A0ABP9KL86_9NOCA
MSVFLPLLVAVPAATGIAGFIARDIPGVNGIHELVVGRASSERPGYPAETVDADSEPAPKPVPRRPRVEYFDLAELTNTDARGFVRQVERYHVEPWGLYMARSVAVPNRQYIESWLLPTLSLRTTVTRSNPAHHRNPEYRLEIGEFSRVRPKRWKAVDHYLDVVVRRGRGAELRGVDELFAAHAAGLIDSATAHRAVERASATLDGLAAHDHCVEQWLATQGITLTWL